MRANLSIKDIKIDYFHWLCEVICVDQGEDSYWFLLNTLHNIPFFWFVPNDDNRGMDGLRLRDEYAIENSIGVLHKEHPPLYGPCSVLEMLIGLARRIDEIMAEPGEDDQTPKWFWKMIENLELEKYTDADFTLRLGEERVPFIIDLVLKREYKRNGQGGLFPLKRPKKDQRKVEIWYQMSAYLVENYFLETRFL